MSGDMRSVPDLPTDLYWRHLIWWQQTSCRPWNYFSDKQNATQLLSTSTYCKITWTTTTGRHFFPAAAATVWNTLPVLVQSSPSIATFCQRLKTFLVSAFISRHHNLTLLSILCYCGFWNGYCHFSHVKTTLKNYDWLLIDHMTFSTENLSIQTRHIRGGESKSKRYLKLKSPPITHFRTINHSFFFPFMLQSVA